MTTFEHALLGVTATMAAGLHRSYGWSLAAMAGVAAVSPDWDGLSLLWGGAAFDRAHRVWGHNVFAAILLGAVLGAGDYHYDLSGRLRRLLGAGRETETGSESLASTRSRHRCWTEAAVWIAVGALAALSHLAADMVVSGTANLGDWELKLLWPFSDRGWVYPLVRWGDPGMSVILFGGVFAMLRWPARLQIVACLTLLLVASYIAFGGRLVR